MKACRRPQWLSCTGSLERVSDLMQHNQVSQRASDSDCSKLLFVLLLQHFKPRSDCGLYLALCTVLCIKVMLCTVFFWFEFIRRCFKFSDQQSSFHDAVQRFQLYLACQGFCTFCYLLVVDQLSFAKMCAFVCTTQL